MRIFNRRAKLDYQLQDRYEAGISLLGSEVKSILEGRISLDQAFVKLKNGEAFLINAHIQPYKFATQELDPRRTRKLLLSRKELVSIETKLKQQKLTLVPVSCYNKGRLVKLEIALAKGKRQYEHREEIKRRDMERDAERELSYGDD